MEKEETKKKETLDERLVELHPKFLETIKEVYPLAVLGSLCIAIAGFTAQTFPDAQTYAITAASLFLIAFAISFLFKIMPNIYFALICYISTALATVFLFLTVFVFAQAIPMVSKSVSAILDCAFFSVLLILCYFSNRLRRREKSNMIRLCFTISIPLLLIGVSYTAINVIASFIGVSLPVLAYHIYITSMFGWIVLVLIILLANYKSRKKKKKS